MFWSDEKVRSVLSEVTGDRTEYHIHLLAVDSNDDLSEATVAFLTRLVSESPAEWCKRWSILLFELWTDAGLINAVFTTLEREFDDVPVFKLFAVQILNKYNSLPPPTEDYGAFIKAHADLEESLQEVIEAALRNERVSALLKGIRTNRAVPVWVTLCDFKDHMRQLKV